MCLRQTRENDGTEVRSQARLRDKKRSIILNLALSVVKAYGQLSKTPI